MKGRAMQKITEYFVVSANHPGQMSKLVNNMIQKGWKVHGYMATEPTYEVMWFHQPMVKHKD